MAIALAACVALCLPAAAAAAPPQIATDGASATSATSARVTGNGNPGGPPTTVHADYALASEPWCATAGAEGTPHETARRDLGGGVVELSEIVVALTGVEPASEYCVELVAENTDGVASGGQARFTTPTPPAIDSESASNVTASDATLEARIDPRGQATTYEFFLEAPSCTTFGPGACEGSGGVRIFKGTIPAGTGDVPVSVDVASAWGHALAADTTYGYRVVATNAANATAYGQERTFATPTAPPAGTAPSEVVTEAPEATPGGGYRLKGRLNPAGLPTTYYFEYGPLPSVCDEDPQDCVLRTAVVGPLTGATQIEVPPLEVSGLAPGETYRYRLVASNAEGTVAGAFVLFAALAPGKPLEVQTGPAEATAGGFRMRGELNPNGLPTTYYFIYKDSGEECEDLLGCGPETVHAGPVTGSSQQEVPAIEVTGLTPGATYRYWLIARNADGVERGRELSFTAPATAGGPVGGGLHETSPIPEPPRAPPIMGRGRTVVTAKPLIPPGQTHKLARALRVCMRHKQHRRRVLCERRAYRLYGTR